MKCLVCGKEFETFRKDKKYCSSSCRLKRFRNTSDETFHETDKHETDVTVSVPKDSWLCEKEGCKLRNLPGHEGMCIYHWRISLGFPHIPKQQYELINV